MFTLTDLYIYPIKSLGGIRLTEAVVEPRGLRHDRRWLLIDAQNRFLTQRTDARLALLTVALTPAALTVRHAARPDLGALHVPLAPPTTAPLDVVIWDDTVRAQPVAAAADAWFSRALDRPVRLVYMPESTHRAVEESAPPTALVSFADAFPFLVIGQAALDDLNTRLRAAGEAAVPMNRFRPSLVFGGGAPHAEDAWGEFTIGAVGFCRVKPCARCVVTTIDQQTAQASREPLRTLSTYRREGAKILFGQNVIPRGAGVIRVGQVLDAPLPGAAS